METVPTETQMDRVQMTNAQVLDAAAAVRELAEVTLPAAAALKVVRMARALDAAAQDIGEVRRKVVERFTETDAAGQPLPALDAEGRELPGHVRLTDAAGFAREMTALLEGATTLDTPPLRMAELGNDFSLAPRVLLGLGPVLAAGQDG
jgi:hypothetical protein